MGVERQKGKFPKLEAPCASNPRYERHLINLEAEQFGLTRPDEHREVLKSRGRQEIEAISDVIGIASGSNWAISLGKSYREVRETSAEAALAILLRQKFQRDDGPFNVDQVRGSIRRCIRISKRDFAAGLKLGEKMGWILTTKEKGQEHAYVSVTNAGNLLVSFVIREMDRSGFVFFMSRADLKEQVVASMLAEEMGTVPSVP